MVEVLGRYSNHPDQGDRLRGVLRSDPDGPSALRPRTPRQVHHRLRADEVADLLSAYAAGVEVADLAVRFTVHRDTVMKIAARHGLRRRQPALHPEQVQAAAHLYESGLSLAAIGEQFHVRDNTVRTYLLRYGVAMRDTQGRPR